jgi:hypothetical protein
MARLLTVVAEAVAVIEPPGPIDWFGDHGGTSELNPQGDRYSLFLGLDAGRTTENSVQQMLSWFGEFRRALEEVDPERFAATVFVLDWPRDQDEFVVAITEDRDIDRLMTAGLCYRPKEARFYASGRGVLAESLRNDLQDKGLIPDQEVISLDEPVAPRPRSNPNDPHFQEALEFLGSGQLTWPTETIRELLRR